MDKKTLYDCIEKNRDVLIDLSDHIWEFAELSMLEYKSAEYYCQLLEKLGFTVERKLCGIPTAFSGSYGSGRPVIGLLGEFDALDGLSQQAASAERRAFSAENTCGHGCGHNLLGTASLGAALAIKEAIAAGELHGTVVFYGCPGEEGCAGKAFMARDGMFKDLDAALTWHPGDTNEVTTGSNAACLQFIYSFTGVSAHAADDPWDGRSALDAAELMNVGVQFLREHMERKASIHYSFLDVGGISPNVVQPTASVLYMIRSENVRKAKALKKRVDDIAQGAALMTGTSVTQRQLDGTASTLSNEVLEKLLYQNFLQAPMPEYTAQEWELASQLKATFPDPGLPGKCTADYPEVKAAVMEKSDGGKKALNDFVIPHVHANSYASGSTDVGDVSWLTPTAQIHVAAWPNGCPGHSWQIVSCDRTEIGHKAAMQAGKVLAAGAIDLFENPGLLNEAGKEFERRTKEGFICPIPEDAVPVIPD